MKRRRFFQAAALAVPAAGSALLAQQPATPATAPNPSPGSSSGSSGMEYPKIETAAADQAAGPELTFFSAAQFAALKRLSDLLMPADGQTPGAVEAKTPEFLDFLIGKSPAERQKIYTDGLDLLNAGKPFAGLNDSEAAALIAPAIKPWNYVAPADPLAHFLEEARRDIRTATLNSREYARAQASEGGSGRRRGGVGMYWYSLDGI